MAFYIIGGSNSIFRDGWVSRFAERVSDPVVNRSVGATTTLAGLFRFLMAGPEGAPGEGDRVIWEYGLNEANHVARGYRRELLLKNVEHLIRLCHDRGCRFIPLIMTQRRQEQAATRDSYYQMLTDLFAHHGISAFDVSQEWRRRFGRARLPDELYVDDAHYARDPELMKFIAEGVVDLAATAGVPAAVTPLYSAGRHIGLLEGLTQDVFENSLMRVPRAKIPLEITLTGRGRVAGICTLCRGGKETGIRVQLRPDTDEMRQMRFSTTNLRDQRIILKSVSLENALGARWDKLWRFEEGDRLRLSPARRPGDFYAEHEILTPLTAPNPFLPAHIAGVLVEYDEVAG